MHDKFRLALRQSKLRELKTFITWTPLVQRESQHRASWFSPTLSLGAHKLESHDNFFQMAWSFFSAHVLRIEALRSQISNGIFTTLMILIFHKECSSVSVFRQWSKQCTRSMQVKIMAEKRITAFLLQEKRKIVVPFPLFFFFNFYYVLSIEPVLFMN